MAHLTSTASPRRVTRQIHVGPVAVGGGAPISVLRQYIEQQDRPA